MDSLKRLLGWVKRNERHLGAILFIFGFITDLFTFALLSVSLANLAFLAYLAVAALATFGSHLLFETPETASLWRRSLAVIAPLAAQYAIGSLLSGFLIFYTKSAAVIVSWPFLLMLALVFIGNEYFRTYYKHLAFQITLFFFALYAYTIFALPLFFRQLGAGMFIASTVVSLVLFVGFLLLLSRLHRPGFVRSLRHTVSGTVATVLFMTLSYFSGFIPPIPLTLPDAGIYHSLEHREGGYVVLAESSRAWWDLRPQTIHHVPGTPLYAFSSVSAPFAFDTSVVHVWEQYDALKKKWVERTRVAFIISGGRDGGYRGYSIAANPSAGKWRVSIETLDRQVIGRLYFTIEDASTTPNTHEETH